MKNTDTFLPPPVYFGSDRCYYYEYRTSESGRQILILNSALSVEPAVYVFTRPIGAWRLKSLHLILDGRKYVLDVKR